MPGLGDEQKVIHALQGLADTVAAAVAALGLARVVRRLSRAAFHLRMERGNAPETRIREGGDRGTSDRTALKSLLALSVRLFQLRGIKIARSRLA